jgi:hypothetical protein
MTKRKPRGVASPARNRAERALAALESVDKSTAAAVKRQQSYDIIAAFRRLVPSAMRTVKEIMEDHDAPRKERLEAAKIVFNRAYGTPLKTTVTAVVSSIPKGQALEEEALRILRARGVIDGGALGQKRHMKYIKDCKK